MLKSKIIAVDFDGTLCENKWPEIGVPNNEVIDYLKTLKQQGAKLILWTCRKEKKLSNAVSWCRELSLEFDAINENIPETIELFGSDTRKIFADEYIDDKMCSRFKLPYVAEGKSSTHSWAERKIEIACKHENPDRKDGEFDYGCSCDVSNMSGLVDRIIDEMFPITMPYCPSNAFEVFCERFSTAEKNSYFITVGIRYCIKPNGEKVLIDQFFKESDNGWDSICFDDYCVRKSTNCKGGNL